MSTAATPKFKSVSELRDAIMWHQDPAYAEKMIHPVPELPTVKDRSAYLIEKAKDKVVLDIGCSGPISEKIKASAKVYYGVDQVQVNGCDVVDLDHRADLMPKHEDVEIVICSEFLEHLTNPGYFLLVLKKYYAEKLIYITVPNAGGYTVQNNCEIVNKDHVCWYSYTTLKTLLTRCGFEIMESRWYHGLPHKAEGIIMVVR